MAYELPQDNGPCEVCGWPERESQFVLAANDVAVGIVPPRQRARGALLVFPRRHVGTPSDLSVSDQAALWRLVHRLTVAIEQAFDPEGLHTWEDIGTGADASFAHLTIDIVPRFKSVDYSFAFYRSLPNLTADERNGQLAALMPGIGT